MAHMARDAAVHQQCSPIGSRTQSKEAKWTSALKMMLADLAMVQGWAAEYQQWLWAQSRRADAARPGAPVGDAPAEAGPREEP